MLIRPVDLRRLKCRTDRNRDFTAKRWQKGGIKAGYNAGNGAGNGAGNVGSNGGSPLAATGVDIQFTFS